MRPHILIVEDDEFIQALLATVLKNEGFRISLATSGEEMHGILAGEPVHLILLDLGLPDEDGLTLARQLRARSSLPIIVLTGRQELDDKLAALEIGADDYLTKPTSPEEIVLRVRNVLERAGTSASADGVRQEVSLLEFGDWKIDLAGRSLTDPAGDDVPLTPAEFNLLAALVQAPNRVLTRDHLLDAVARDDEPPNTRTIDVLVSRVRKKIEPDPRKPTRIVTVTGYGYKLNTD